MRNLTNLWMNPFNILLYYYMPSNQREKTATRQKAKSVPLFKMWKTFTLSWFVEFGKINVTKIHQQNNSSYWEGCTGIGRERQNCVNYSQGFDGLIDQMHQRIFKVSRPICVNEFLGSIHQLKGSVWGIKFKYVFHTKACRKIKYQTIIMFVISHGNCLVRKRKKKLFTNQWVIECHGKIN